MCVQNMEVQYVFEFAVMRLQAKDKRVCVCLCRKYLQTDCCIKVDLCLCLKSDSYLFISVQTVQCQKYMRPKGL